jgi:hypothetical protein
MKRWCRILPLWFVRWYALNFIERSVDADDCLYVSPWPDTRFYLVTMEKRPRFWKALGNEHTPTPTRG